MKVIDINGKEREVQSIKRITFPIRNAITGDTFSNREYVEVVIVGKSGRVWKEFYPLEDFERLNPNVVIS